MLKECGQLRTDRGIGTERGAVMEDYREGKDKLVSGVSRGGDADWVGEDAVGRGQKSERMETEGLAGNYEGRDGWKVN